MADVPSTRYAEGSDGLFVGYQVLGDGPMDIALLPMHWTNVELFWDDPSTARFFHRLASFGRLILFDKRGCGVSDPVPHRAIPTVEEWVDDLITVLDAVGSDQVHVLGFDAGGPVALLAAGAHASRISSLVLFNTFARLSRAPDYPIGLPESLQNQALATLRREFANGVYPEVMMPNRINDDEFRRWWARFGRQSIGLGAAIQTEQAMFALDVRNILDAVHQSTVVLHRAGNNYVRPAHGKYLADHLANAKYVELPGDDHLYNSGDMDELVDQIEEFLTGARHTPNVDRVLATVVFTDIVDSTVRAAALGDRRWKELLDHHDAIVARALARFRGRQVKTTGDGVLAVFDGPARAISATLMIRDALTDAGLDIRSGIHTSEIELRGDDIAGIGVIIAARISALAAGGEVLASRTVADLVAGSGIAFEDRGDHELKGVPGSWHLLTVAT